MLKEMNFQKNKTKIDLPAQYSMSFPVIGVEVLYIIVYIKRHIGIDIDTGHYVYDVSHMTWWNCDDTTMINSGWTHNI